MTTTIALGRRALTLLSAGVLAATGTALLASGREASATPGGPHQVWVCKYVHKPGAGEVLKAGKNPIRVDWAALTGKQAEPHVGDAFSDRQTNSVVVQIGGNDPGIGACPTGATPTTPSQSSPPPASPSTTTSASPTSMPTTSESPTSMPTTSESPTSMPATSMPPTSMPPTSTHSRGPHGTPPATTAGRPGGTMPGTGAPGTGGAGDSNPVNGIVGSALMVSAAGVLGAGALRRRRDALR